MSSNRDAEPLRHKFPHISVGIEDPEDILADLDQALAAATA